MKVLKFGGTSLANSSSILQAGAVVKSDKQNRFVVVSAPGKREKTDTKVTDLLYGAFDAFKTGTSIEQAFGAVEKRFDEIISGLKIKISLKNDFDIIKQDIKNGACLDYVASRGEYLSGKVCAEFFNLEFVDAAGIIKFDASGRFLQEETNSACNKKLKGLKGAVIPGFYGSMPNGQIKTFSRGGSDITGAIIARAVGASVYENWTDVNGFMAADPRVVDNPQRIDMLTYKELRELSYMGASVLHADAIFPVRKSDIPIHIRNTFCASCTGTRVVPTKKYLAGEFNRTERTITGIAGKTSFCAIYIEKSMLNDELGFARRVLSVLERHGISLEQMPSGIDTLTVLFDCSNVSDDTLKLVLDDINKECAPDTIHLVKNIALIAIVGHGMSRKTGVAKQVFGALSDAGINVRLIDQGSSELNIIVGVEASDYERAIVALYEALKE